MAPWISVGRSHMFSLYCWRIGVINLAISQFGTAAAESRLSVSQESLSGKSIFQLDDRPFYPLIYSDHFSKLSSQALQRLSERGFNMVQVAADTEETTLPEF